MQSAIVFSLDNKPIVGIESISCLLSSFFITFNLTQKQKPDKIGDSGRFQDSILPSETFERLTTILAKVLIRANKALFLFTRPIKSVLIIVYTELIKTSIIIFVF